LKIWVEPSLAQELGLSLHTRKSNLLAADRYPSVRRSTRVRDDSSVLEADRKGDGEELEVFHWLVLKMMLKMIDVSKRSGAACNIRLGIAGLHETSDQA
jgi:hypothetical protein